MDARINATRRLGGLVLGLLVAATLLAACGDDDQAGTSDTTGGSSSSTGAPESTTSAPVTGTDVTIKDYTFSPANLVVHVGDTVTWTNEDGFDHKATSDDDVWPTEAIKPGATFDVTFDTAGTYAYHCGIHNYMKGVITVTDA